METLQRTANRGSISTGYNIDNSLKVESDNSESLNRTLGTPTNVDKATFSFWFKRTELGRQWLFSTRQNTSSPYDTFRISMTADDEIQVQNYSTSYNARIVTNRVFRDTAAWYHIVASIDTTQSTAGDRIRLYINGVEETSFSTEDQPLQNSDLFLESGRILEIGRFIPDQGLAGALYECEGYLAEAHFVDGQQLAPTEFGEFDSDSGIWKPKEYSGTHGNNGHYLKFDSSGSLGTDSSGNGNNFTLNNIAAVDQANDTPTNSFCIPLLIQPYNSTDSISHTEGGTKLTTASGTGWRTNMATISLSSGKWYFEAKHPGTIDGDAIMTSIVPTARFGNSAYASFYGGQSSGDGIGWYWDSTRFRYDDGSTISPPTNTVNSGDILCIALDMDNNFVYSRINGGAWHNNGSADGDPTSGSSGTGGFAVADEPHMICTSMYHPSKNFFVNFGGYNAFPVSSAVSDANGYGVFEYAPPTGYYAICTKNLAEYG